MPGVLNHNLSDSSSIFIILDILFGIRTVTLGSFYTNSSPNVILTLVRSVNIKLLHNFGYIGIGQ